MNVSEIIDEVVTTKAQRVLTWLYAQEPADAETFRLDLVLDETVMPGNVQAFASMLLGDTGEERSFSATECSELVRQSYEYCAHYLATPNAFLSQFMASGTEHSRIEKLAALIDYSYYGDFLFEWLRDAGLNSSEPTRLAFLRRTDRLAIAYADLQQVTTYFEPFEAFYRELIDDGESFEKVIEAMMADKAIANEALQNEPLTSASQLANFLKKQLEIVAAPDTIVTETQPEAPTISELADEVNYEVFLADLRNAGVHLPMPSHLRRSTEPHQRVTPPLRLLVNDLLRQKTIDKVFHGNEFEYDRLVSMIDHAPGFDDAVLNLETVVHLQKAERASKLIETWTNVLRMKFAQRTLL